MLQVSKTSKSLVIVICLIFFASPLWGKDNNKKDSSNDSRRDISKVKTWGRIVLVPLLGAPKAFGTFGTLLLKPGIALNRKINDKVDVFEFARNSFWKNYGQSPVEYLLLYTAGKILNVTTAFPNGVFYFAKQPWDKTIGIDHDKPFELSNESVGAKVKICLDCHGSNGVLMGVPVIHGQKKNHLSKMLKKYRCGKYQDLTMFTMNDITKGSFMSFEDIERIAAYFNQLDPSQIKVLVNPGRGDVRRGKEKGKLCRGCHNSFIQTFGPPKYAPDLKGQRTTYIISSIKAYAKRKRKNIIMYFEGHLSSFLRLVENEQDVEDVAAYFNSLRTRSQRVDFPLDNDIVSKNESFDALSHVFENIDKSTKLQPFQNVLPNANRVSTLLIKPGNALGD